MTAGFLPYVAEATGPFDTLTREDMERAVEALGQPRTAGCREGAHIVPAKALYRPGTYICGECGALVDVPVPLTEAL